VSSKQAEPVEALSRLIVRPIAAAAGSLAAALRSGKAPAALGLRRSARLPVMAALSQELGWPLLLITDRADRALSQLEELGLWAPDRPRLLFPEPTPLFYENAAWGEATRRDRLAVLTRLAAYHLPGASAPGGGAPAAAPILVAPARAVMTRTLPRRDFLKASRTLRRGAALPLDDLARLCVSLGYQVVNTVIASGQFARRGGILDLWPPAEPQPVRLEFFGDEIDTLRRFDPATQRTLKPGDGAEAARLLLTPAREVLAPAGGDAESLGLPPGEAVTEFHLPLVHSFPASLLDYLPAEALVLVDDRQALEDAVGEVEEQAVHLRQDFIKDGTLAENFPLPYLTWAEVQDSLSMHPCLDLGSNARLDLEVPVGGGLAATFNAGPRFGGRLKPTMDHVLERYTDGEQVVIVSRQAARLQELWGEQSHYFETAAADRPAPVFLENSLGEGWTFFPESGPALHLLTDGEIFGWRRPEPRQRQRQAAEAPEAAYADLQPGDWVVHVDHGVGRLRGLVNRVMDGLEREYLCVEYADQAELYVPVHQVDRLTRYVGPEGRSPALSHLGGVEWRNAKAEAKEATQEVAQELLELYAQRSVVEGFAFSQDAPWQKELEASFPYIETADQLRVLSEVKQDMQSPRPMDRLICGDVGYGKTEVALRAAFKAVMDGKQVAVLVPTTVLAQQHLNTFHQRLAAFPVTVEMLSRFRTPQQQRDIIYQAAQGGVDILIGTHRLFSSDVQFKDLGLLIIDEEQRFGVTHKERLKRMRTEVDVLTLTATPIPRTLYMALSGVRDISTINTPPEERLPIVTHVGPYSPKLARQAILRELERGGQVFFVHNRVQTIGAMRQHLERLVPEARLAVAHGQMPEHELSQRMELFANGEVDVLLSTSIIESGLDIPSANTLIVDRADTFGLAQLYQLRGRVGRGAQRAYAYFFRHNRILPTLDGRQRLETIAENNQLGAGFSIAMRDLEIRGTGDILGTRQHGHIAAVGFHLYTRMLADAVRRLRVAQGTASGVQAGGGKRTPLEELMAPVSRGEASVELPIPISIPADYVTDRDGRLGLYRRMADLGELAEVDALGEELADRFGPLPETARNLLFQLQVRLLADQAGLSGVGPEMGQIVLRFPENTLPASMPELDPQVRVGKIALWLPYSANPGWRQLLVRTLQALSQGKTESAR
jgi:transcription-repair coupling factor (superfamily II helicase)